jgi:hypothetical protein
MFKNFSQAHLSKNQNVLVADQSSDGSSIESLRLDKQPGLSCRTQKKRYTTPVPDFEQNVCPSLNHLAQGIKAFKNRTTAKVTSSCPKKIVKTAQSSGIFAKNDSSLIGKILTANIFGDKKYSNLTSSKSSTK